MDDVLQVAADHVQRNIPCALCTVVRTSGSVPRHAGSKMLVDANGHILSGTVGGGEMENRVATLAQSAIREGKPTLTAYQLANPQDGDPGICGGTAEVFIEPLLTSPTLLIVGAGHVGRALIHLAKWAGYYVILTDDRPELCAPSVCPGADEYLPGALRETLAHIALNRLAYVALVTRSYPIDIEAIPLLLQSPVSYIGVIGSRRRWLATAQELSARGISDADLQRIHSPIGIEIGAETPEEIAISILAEIIMVRSGR
ncbi:MAG: XdhC family protein [Chloroflexi bacterium]|nr:XdhC family protein [Chloroflexota bacterium]